MKTRMTFALISLVLIYSSCKKGDVGPSGPQGPPGTPNVIYTDWFQASSWIKDTVFSIYRFTYTKEIPEITAKVIDSGTVLTFGKLLGYNPLVWPTDQIGQLPIILHYQLSTVGPIYQDTWSAGVSTGNVKIRFDNDQNYYNSIATNHLFRCIVIPGGVKSTTSTSLIHHAGGSVESNVASMQLKNGRVDFSKMSYEEVCGYFNIPQ